MPTIADALSAALAALPTRRETQAKRSALLECNGSYTWDGERCAGCTACGRVFVASSLRLTKDAHPRLLCRRCFAQTKGVSYG
jgi:hypothetical protein